MAANAEASSGADAGRDTSAIEPKRRCPVCDVGYESVSIHGTGLMVNLLDNERYRRVCFEPTAENGGEPRIRFYHHTHEQSALSE